MKIGSMFTAIVVAAAGVTFGASASAGSTSFTDSTFPIANYSTAFEVLSDPSNIISLSQCASCGDPGTALELAIGFPNGGGTYNVNSVFGIINTTFTYDPATQGAITSIDASVDKNFSITMALLYGNTFRPLIEQDGKYYEAAISGPNLQGPGSTEFQTISASGLTAVNFLEIDPLTGVFGTAHPDFSGDEMTFGLGQLLGAPAIDDSSADIVFDNLDITLNSVPEPHTWVMVIIGVFGLGASLRRRRRAAMLAA